MKKTGNHCVKLRVGRCYYCLLETSLVLFRMFVSFVKWSGGFHRWSVYRRTGEQAWRVFRNLRRCDCGRGWAGYIAGGTIDRAARTGIGALYRRLPPLIHINSCLTFILPSAIVLEQMIWPIDASFYDLKIIGPSLMLNFDVFYISFGKWMGKDIHLVETIFWTPEKFLKIFPDY